MIQRILRSDYEKMAAPARDNYYTSFLNMKVTVDSIHSF